jgi:hypothetical protein
MHPSAGAGKQVNSEFLRTYGLPAPSLRHGQYLSGMALPFPARGVIHVMTAQPAAQRTTTMTTFTIDTDNHITAHATPEAAAASSSTPFDTFSSPAEFAELAQSWPAKRLVAIWNSLPGAPPLQKFQDRSSATRRLWERMQGLVSCLG